jgi:hypothetical protein
LRDLVDATLAHLTVHGPERSHFWSLERKGQVERDDPSRSEGPVEIDACHRAIHMHGERRP